MLDFSQKFLRNNENTLNFNIDTTQIVDANTEANKLIDSVEGVDEAIKNQAKTLNDNITAQKLSNASMATGTKATQGFTVATKAATVAKSAFNVALNTGITLLISMMATGFISWLIDLSQAEEKVAESAQNSKEKIKELNTQFEEQKQVIDKAIESYDKLAKGVNTSTNENISLSTEDYEEYLNLNEQLVEIFPELYKGLDENGNAILTFGDKSSTAASELQKLTDELKIMNSLSVYNEMDSLTGGLNLNYKDMEKASEYYNQIVKTYESSQDTINEILNNDNFFNEDHTFTDLSTDDIYLLDAVNNAYKEFYNNLSRVDKIGIPSSIITSPDELTYTGNQSYDYTLESIENIPPELREQLLANIRQNVITLKGDMQKTISDALMEKDTTEQAFKSDWNSYLASLVQSMTAYSDFQGLDAETENIIKSILGQLPSEVFNTEDFANADAVYDWVYTNFIYPLKNIPDSDKSEVYDSLNSLLNLDELATEENLNPKELANRINEIIASLGQYIDPEVLSSIFNFDSYYDAAKVFQQNVSSIANQFGNSTKEVSEVFKDLSIDTTDEYAAFKEAAKGVDTLDEAINKYIVSTKEANSIEPFSKQEMISKINELSEGFESLDKIMASIKEEDKPFDYSLLDDKNFTETFSGLDSYSDFIETISNSPKDIEACQSAFDNLVTEWLNSTDILDGLSEETKQLTIDMLSNMGVANSEEVIVAALAAKHNMLAAEKYYNANAGYELRNATMEEVTAFYNEASAAGVSEQAMAQLQLTKLAVNNVKIDTASDIDQIINLANAAGASSEVLEKLAGAKALFAKAEAGKLEMRDWGAMAAIRQELRGMTEEGYDWGFSIDSSQFKTATYGGGTKTAGSGGGSGSGSKSEPEEFDWIERKLDVINDKIEKTKTNIDTLVGYKSKNAETDNALDLMTEKLNTLQAAYDRYMAEANSIGLSQDYINKIQNGEINIEEIGDENLSNLINEYQDLYDKAQDTQTEIENAKIEIKELNLSKLDNIINQYDQILDIRNSMVDTEEQLLDLREQSGEDIISDDYISLAQKQFQIVQGNKEAFDELSQEMASMDLKEGSEEWKEYNDQLEEYKSNMISAAQAVEDYKDAITDLVYKDLNDYVSAMDSLNGSISTMNGLIGDTGLIDKSGDLTDRGLAQVALYSQQLSISKQQAEEYDEAIKSLNEALDVGLITQDEYNERLYEYISAQNSAVESVKAAQDAIINLVKEGIQAEIDAKKELIDKTKEELEAEKDLHDYQNSISEKQDNISKLERQIAALSNSTSREDLAQRLQLQQELAEAQEDLYETQYDHQIEQRQEALDKEFEEYEANKQAEMDELDTNLDKQNAAIKDYLNQVQGDYTTVYGILKQYGDEYNLSATDDLTKPWESGKNAANMCADAIGEAVANINYEIDSINLDPLYELIDALNSIGYGSGGLSGNSYDNITSKGSWQQGQGGKWWFGEEYNPNGDYYYASGGIYTINDKQYLFDDAGYMQTGWYDDGGNWRYFETDNDGGEMVKSSWRQGADGKWYYLTKDGTMAENMAIKQQNGNEYYYVDENGVWDGTALTEEEVKRLKLKVGYKTGTKNARKGLNFMDEEGLGSEVIVTKHGTLRQFEGGETVFNSDMVNKLWDFASNPKNFIKDAFGAITQKVNLDNIRPMQSQVVFEAPLFNITGGLSSDMVGYIDEKCNWLQKNVGKLAYKDLKGTLLGK